MPTAFIRIHNGDAEAEVRFDYTDPYDADEVTYSGSLRAFLMEFLNNRTSPAYNPRNVEGPAPRDFFWCYFALKHAARRYQLFTVDTGGDVPEMEHEPGVVY